MSSNKSIDKQANTEYRNLTIELKENSSFDNSQENIMTEQLNSTMLQVIKTTVEAIFATHVSIMKSSESSESTDSSESQKDIKNSLIDSETVK